LALTFQNISRDAWNKHSIAAFRAQDCGYRCTVADSKSLEGAGFDARLFGRLARSGSWPAMRIISMATMPA
jgi:hypothetical protein